MQAIQAFLEQLKTDLSQRMKERGQDKRGRIARGLAVQMHETGGALTGWKWFNVRIETGRGPTRNTTAGSPTLRERIEKWVEENNIGDPKKRKSIAYLITRKIHRSGDRLYRNQHPTLSRPTGTFYDLLNDGRIERLKEDISAEIKAEILEIYKTLSNANAN